MFGTVARVIVATLALFGLIASTNASSENDSPSILTTKTTVVGNLTAKLITRRLPSPPIEGYDRVYVSRLKIFEGTLLKVDETLRGNGRPFQDIGGPTITRAGDAVEVDVANESYHGCVVYRRDARGRFSRSTTCLVSANNARFDVLQESAHDSTFVALRYHEDIFMDSLADLTITRNDVTTEYPPIGWRGRPLGAITGPEFITVDAGNRQALAFGGIIRGANCCVETLLFVYDRSARRFVRYDHVWGYYSWNPQEVRLPGERSTTFVLRDYDVGNNYTGYIHTNAGPVRLMQFIGGRYVDVTRNYPQIIARDTAAVRHDLLTMKNARDRERACIAYAGDLALASGTVSLQSDFQEICAFTPQKLRRLRTVLVNGGYGESPRAKDFDAYTKSDAPYDPRRDPKAK